MTLLALRRRVEGLAECLAFAASDPRRTLTSYELYACVGAMGLVLRLIDEAIADTPANDPAWHERTRAAFREHRERAAEMLTEAAKLAREDQIERVRAAVAGLRFSTMRQGGEVYVPIADVLRVIEETRETWR